MRKVHFAYDDFVPKRSKPSLKKIVWADCSCVCIYEGLSVFELALGFRLNQLKIISPQPIPKYLFFHQQPQERAEHLLQQKFPPVFFCLCSKSLSLCVIFCLCVSISILTRHLWPVCCQAESDTMSSEISFTLPSVSIFLPLFFFPKLSSFLILLLLLQRYYLCCCHASPHNTLFSCSVMLSVICRVSLSPPSASIFNLSLSPTLHPWLC